MFSLVSGEDYPVWSNNKAFHLENEEDAHIWRVKNVQIEEIAAYQTILSGDEIKRADRFYRKEDKCLYINCHHALRMILSKYIQVDPAAITFTTTQNYKPQLHQDLFTRIPLHFNISHSGNYSLIAIAQKPVGVDLELIDPTFNYPEIIEAHFTAEEAAHVKLAEDERTTFYKIWTRKEAFYKATGAGLIGDLKDDCFFKGTHLNNSITYNQIITLKTFEVDFQHVGSVAFYSDMLKISYFNF